MAGNVALKLRSSNRRLIRKADLATGGVAVRSSLREERTDMETL
jgi:hypothetical protein